MPGKNQLSTAASGPSINTGRGSFHRAIGMKVIALVWALLVVVGVLTPQSEAGAIKDCWDQWSRCSGWSKLLTGKVWLGCNDHCIKNKGKRGGSCVLVKAKCRLSDTAYQCQCF